MVVSWLRVAMGKRAKEEGLEAEGSCKEEWMLALQPPSVGIPAGRDLNRGQEWWVDNEQEEE